MCGRFVSASPPDEIARYFDAAAPEQVLEASYNVAPTDDVYAVLETGGVRRIEALHWGLVPWWSDKPSTGARMINARSETLARNNAFKAAFRARRCIVPADGFYEWTKVPGQKKKQPVFVHRPDGEPLAFAGLWETWRSRDASGARGDEQLHSCTIITTAANDKVAAIHDRMPVILPPSAWESWLSEDLGRNNEELDTLGRFLIPAPSEVIDLYPVSTEVNNVRNNGAELVVRVDPSTGEIDGQGTLL